MQNCFVVVSLALLLSTTMVFAQSPEGALASEEGAESSHANTPAVSKPGYSANTLYALLVAEIAGQRQMFDVSLGNYLLEAHRTQDPGVAARATQIAQYIGADQAALDAATLWAKLDDHNPRAHHAISMELIKAQRFAESTLHLQAALTLDPTLGPDFISTQGANLSVGARKQLLDALQPVLKMHPQHPGLLLNLAHLHQQQKELTLALDFLNQLLAHSKHYYPAWNMKARILAGQNKTAEALTAVQSALDEFPADKALTILKARLLISHKDIPGAREVFAKLTERYPEDAHILLPLALTQLELKEFEGARQTLNMLLAQGKMLNEVNFYLGKLEQKDGQQQRALDHYLAMHAGREYLAAQNHIVQIYIEQERFSEAQAHVQNQRVIDSSNSQAYYLMEVELLNRAQRHNESLEVLNNALQAYANNIDLRYSRAMVAGKLGDISQLELDLSYIIDQEPENATALNALGYTLADQTPRLDEALSLISKARTLSPEDPAIIDSLGWVYYRMGRLTEAVELLKEAYKLFPDPEVAAHLGEVLWQLDQKPEAHTIWQQGLDKQPDSEIIKETMDRLQTGR